MLIDKFLEQAIEAEVDAISDGEEVIIPSVMEHIELAGIHSGDSACVLPPHSLSPEICRRMEEYSVRIAKRLKVVGLMNIQYAIANGTVYILEANPRASRTVPLVSKVMGINMAKIATQVMLGKKLKDLGVPPRRAITHFGVKEAVFPFNMFPSVDPVLGPEMRATGEVLGMAGSFGLAFYKAQTATGLKLPLEGMVFISVADRDKEAILPAARSLRDLGFTLLATNGTQAFLEKNGVPSDNVLKMHEGRPSIADAILNDRVHLIINTPQGAEGKQDDSYIRKTAIQKKVPYITTVSAALAAVEGIKAIRGGDEEVRSLQSYHQKA